MGCNPMPGKLLIVLSNLAVNNGVASCIMNNYSQLCEMFEHIDFLVLKKTGSVRETQIIESGNEIIVLPDAEVRRSKSKEKFILNLLRRGYDIVHVNVPYHNGSMILRMAQKKNIPVRIYHSHNPKRVDTMRARLVSGYYTPQCVRAANYYIACSETAGKTVFGNRAFEILHNAIPAEKFQFDKQSRELLRKQYHLEGSLVVGAVCRIDQQKNPFFIVDIFSEIAKKREDACLVWLGAGAMEGQIKEYVQKKKLADRCLLLGSRSDVNKWYSAMDMLLFPSIFEGLGMVLIEAQTAGLMCFASDCVPKDTCVTDHIQYYPLEWSAAQWSEKIIQEIQKLKQRHSYIKEVRDAGYDVDTLLNNGLVALYKRFFYVAMGE